MKTNTLLPPADDSSLPPDLSDAEARMLRDTAALAALAFSPGVPAPEGVLEQARLRIRQHSRRPAVARHVLTWSGWAAAAACVLLWPRTRGEDRADNADGRMGQGAGPLAAGNKQAGRSPGDAAGSGGDIHSVPREKFATLPGITSRNVSTASADDLRKELERMRSAQNARFTPAPGLARTVVVEMTGSGSREKPRTTLTPERVSDIMAAGLSGEGGAPVKLKPGSRPSELILEGALPPLGFLDLPEEMTLRHRSFPADDWENQGLIKSEDGRFYDAAGKILWEPSTGGEFTGRRVPEGFDTAPFSAPRRNDAAQTETGSDAVAYTLFDETTGTGSILISNLPEVPEGFAYQLWLTDPARQQPVSVGLLPALENGGGRVFFDTEAPGFAPAGYFLTVEPAKGATQPGGRVVLSGPDIPTR